MGLFSKEEIQEDNSPKIELVYYQKDSKGNPIGAKKSVKGDGFKIWRAWMNSGGSTSINKKKKKKKNEVLPSGEQAKKMAMEIAEHTEQQQTI